VLWMKELGLLFGNTAFATATTLATFFLGLATGGYFWGQRAARLDNPLQTYGLLELAVAISVLGYFQILDAYHALYPSIFELLGNFRWLFILVKFLLSILLLFPAAFFIGGTLPVMSEYLVSGTQKLGQKISSLYAINTLGAAAGTLLAGFYLPKNLGFTASYWLAIFCTVSIGCAALILARRWPYSRAKALETPSRNSNRPDTELISLNTIRVLAIVSGFGTLCLQVLWTRMFAQVLQNSVYTFATILFVFLLSLAVGATAANRIMKYRLCPKTVLFWLFSIAGIFVATTPFLFNFLTNELHYIGSKAGWDEYLFEVFKLEFVIMALPVTILGAIFPFLLKIAEPWETSSGRLVGQLVALNTAGSIIGSIAAGFIILQLMGVWAGIRLIGIIYLLAGLYVTNRQGKQNQEAIIIPMTGIILLVSVLDTTRLPQLRIDPVVNEESLLEVTESSSGTVAIVRRRNSLKIKVNNYYTLGGSGSKNLEEMEGYLPVLLHPKPHSVFFLGLGTGISAGAVLHFPVNRLVVAELIPDVVYASEKYFGRFNNNLFFDPRAQVIEEDGRNFLAGSLEKFDIVISDLFVPWRSGAGSLYSLEHYQTVKDSLQKNGLFMQWLPAYQLSQTEFGSIVRTMAEVFPQITLWRGDFSSKKPIIGLLAQSENKPLSLDALIFSDKNQQNLAERVPILAHYIGNIGKSHNTFMTYPINSDDKPVIEYQAPITQRQQKIHEKNWMTGMELIQFMEHIEEIQAAKTDPYLKKLSEHARNLPKAGMYLHRSQVLKNLGQVTGAKKAYAGYEELLR